MLRSPWISALLILALAIRGLIPDGYMPDDPGREGRTVLKICHSVGGTHAPLPIDKDAPVKRDGSSDHDRHSSCPYSVLLAGAPLPALPALLTAAAPITAATQLPTVLPISLLTRPALPPRGPPTLLL